MYKLKGWICLFWLFASVNVAMAQDLKTNVRNNKELDSLRDKLENGPDSVVFTSRFVRYTTLKLTRDSIQTLPLDTSFNGMQNYSPVEQPKRPTIYNGNIGLAARDLLFQPNKNIGFDPGFHALDWYAKGHDDIMYYQARTPFTNLFYGGQYSGDEEQLLRVLHSQNIKKNWNMGASYNRIGANGIYSRQRGDVLNGTVFSWYTSPNKRYTLFANAIFNTLKAYENGGPVANVFDPEENTVARNAQAVRLNNSRQIYRKNTVMLKQSYFVGRIDTLDQEITKKVFPTNKITYTLQYDKDAYAFQKNEQDNHEVLPAGIADLSYTNDSTGVMHLKNEFIYSFFLRGKNTKLIKNELKIDAGIRHDFYDYSQQVQRSEAVSFYRNQKSFQNVTVLGNAGYRFSDRVDLNMDVQQIVQGRQAGDFLYEAKSNVLVTENVGRIILGGYMQLKSPEEIYTKYYGNHFSWENDNNISGSGMNAEQINTLYNGRHFNLGKDWEKTKTANLSFRYLNERLKLDASASYYMINDYLYFKQPEGQGNLTVIVPEQYTEAINLLKFTLGKKISFGKFTLDSYLVYQKSNAKEILRTPDFYTFNSFFVDQTFFKILRTNIGFDVRYNTKYANYSYSPAVGQFYLGSAEKQNTYPVVDFWIRASLRKANIFLKYEYINQGLQSNGYYTVNNYPMSDRLFKVGLNWNFYD